MPRYFFHLHRDSEQVPDEEGMELEDDAVAKCEAMESLREMIEESLKYELKPLIVIVEIVRDGVGVLDRLTAQIAVHTRS